MHVWWRDGKCILSVEGCISHTQYLCAVLLCIYIAFWNFFIASVYSFFILFKKSGIDKSTEWSTIPAYPSLMCLFTEGANSSKILRLMFVYVLFHVNLCRDRFCGFRRICVWWLVCRVDKRQFEVCFSPDVIRCGLLGSKYRLTN